MLTDAYNLSHFFLKENVDKEISLIFNRNRPMILNGFSQVVHNIVDQPITQKMVLEAKREADNMGMPFPLDMWERVVNEFDGYLPLKIQALPDGTWCPKGTPFAKITNTEKGFGELVTWFEPVLLHTSFDSGCATRAFEMRKYLDSNKLNRNRIHSFGMRGHASMENAIKAGKAWRLFLNGTDDFHTQWVTDANGKSIPATAHKTIQQFNNELDAYYHSIDATKAHGFNIVAIVIDTYDPITFIKYYAKKVAEYGKSRGVHIVFRPDSGNIFDQAYGLYCIMWSSGLQDNTSIILGEGITFDKIREWDIKFRALGVDLNYINYGMGAGFYKDIDRDYLGFAMKTSFSNGQNRMKFSADPIKQSIAGDVKLYTCDGYDDIWVGYLEQPNIPYFGYKKLYKTIYELNGESKVYSWNEIKERAEKYLTMELQENINIGGDVNDESERLRKKYITDVKLEY